MKSVIKSSIVILILIMITLVSMDVMATSQIEIKPSAGFDDYISDDVNVEIPINLEINNNGEDITGIVQIIVDQNDGYGNDKKVENIIFQKAIILPTNSKKNINMGFYKNEYRLDYRVRILDDKKNILHDEKFDLNSTEEALKTNIIIGALVDDKDNYMKLDGKLVLLDNEKLINSDVLSGFDYILIDNYSENLELEQINYLDEWKNKGGVFIVGDRASTKIVNKIKLDDENKLDLKNKNFDAINKELLNIKDKNERRDYYYYGSDNVIPYKIASNFELIKIILMIFVVTVGPVNYLALKLIDKREYFWYSVPAIVVVFSILIYSVSKTTDYDGAIINKSSYVNVSENLDRVQIQSNTTNFAVKGSRCEVTFPKEAKVDYPELSIYQFNKTQEDILILDSEANTLEYLNTGFWSTVEIPILWESDSIGKISSSIEMKDKKLVGFVENNTGEILEDVIFYYSEKYLYLGDIRVGEKVEIDLDLENNNQYYSSNRDVSDLVYYSDSRDKYLKSEGIDIDTFDKNNFLTENFKRSFTDDYFRMSKNELNSMEYFIYGWNESDLGFEAKINKELVNNIDRNMFFARKKINIEKGQSIYLNNKSVKLSILNENGIRHDNRDERFYNKGSIEFEYSLLNNNIKVDEIKIFRLNGNDIEDFKIYNNKENKWKSISDDFIVKNDELENYLNENRLKFKINLKEDGYTDVPQIEFQGVMK